MRINSIKLTVVLIVSLMISLTLFGLFFIEMPTGNRDIANIVLGSLVATFGMAIGNLFKKE